MILFRRSLYGSTNTERILHDQEPNEVKDLVESLRLNQAFARVEYAPPQMKLSINATSSPDFKALTLINR